MTNPTQAQRDFTWWSRGSLRPSSLLNSSPLSRYSYPSGSPSFGVPAVGSPGSDPLSFLSQMLNSSPAPGSAQIKG